MSRTVEEEFPLAHRYFSMYDLAKAVGASRPNLADDVKLVQSLFQASQSVNDPFMRGVPPMVVTGLFDAELGQAIRQYQTNARQAGGNNAIDGVMDPLPSRSGTEGDWDRSFRGGEDSTMGMLCYRLFRAGREIYVKVGETLGLPWKPDPFEG